MFFFIVVFSRKPFRAWPWRITPRIRNLLHKQPKLDLRKLEETSQNKKHARWRM